MASSDIQRTIEEMFEAFGTGRWSEPELILRNLADNGEWWVAGSLPSSGTFSKKEMLENLRQIPLISDHGLRITPTSWVIAGDKVAIEAESFMKLRSGRVYNNRYHFAVEMENGKILKVKEYMDTHHAYAVFGP